MSYTIAHDQGYEDHRWENRLNVVFRHCKIGKVNRKAPVVIPSVFRVGPEITQIDLDKILVGSPYRPISPWSGTPADLRIPAHGVMI